MYELTNHLGNVQVVISDRKRAVQQGGSPIIDYYTSDVVSASDYYPFGSLMPGRNFSSASYRFGFNGMEKDDEVKGSTGSSYTTYFRQYDPRLGRFHSMDPVAYPWQSDYAAFNNNPIYYADPSGAEGKETNKSKEAKGKNDATKKGETKDGDSYTDNKGKSFVFDKDLNAWVPGGNKAASAPQQSTSPQQVKSDNPTLHGRIKRNIIKGAARGKLKKVEGVIVHRTDSYDAKQTMGGFKSGTGTQFLIDREGNIFQTTDSPTDKTWHVGAIKSRGEAEGTSKVLKKNPGETWGKYAKRQHQLEKKKDYPTRYPYNDTSIGIEFMGKYNGKKNGWEKVTAKQVEAGLFLIHLLQNRYNLSDMDVYNHEDISRKTPGEGGSVTKALGINQVDN